MEGEIFTTTGLALDIIGVVMIFKYGLPENVDRKGMQYMVLEQQEQEEADKATRYDLYSLVALCMLVIGFLMQIVGVWT